MEGKILDSTFIAADVGDEAQIEIRKQLAEFSGHLKNTMSKVRASIQDLIISFKIQLHQSHSITLPQTRHLVAWSQTSDNCT